MVVVRLDSLNQQVLEHKRSTLDESRVQYFVDHPEEIRDILIYENPSNGERIVVNGCHRTEAARRLDRAEIDAELRSGTRVDALRYRDLADRRPWYEVDSSTDR